MRSVISFNIPPQEPLIPKGRRKEETLPGLRDKLNVLREHANVPIANLDSHVLRVFFDAQNTIKIMYDTDDFDEIYNTAVKIFKNDKLYDLGTVGAYFTGCLCGTDLKHGGACGVACARSMPPPRSQNHKFCGMNVLWLAPNDDGDHELRLLSSANTHKGILHISGDRFLGLTRSEKAALTDKKITEVEIYRYTKSNKDYKYKRLSDGFISVDDLPERHVAAPEHHHSNYGWILLIVIFLILIVLIYLLYRRKTYV